MDVSNHTAVPSHSPSTQPLSPSPFHSPSTTPSTRFECISALPCMQAAMGLPRMPAPVRCDGSLPPRSSWAAPPPPPPADVTSKYASSFVSSAAVPSALASAGPSAVNGSMTMPALPAKPASSATMRARAARDAMAVGHVGAINPRRSGHKGLDKDLD